MPYVKIPKEQQKKRGPKPGSGRNGVTVNHRVWVGFPVDDHRRLLRLVAQYEPVTQAELIREGLRLIEQHGRPQ